jgi:ribonucleoside-diphosphate reductase alpha chain
MNAGKPRGQLASCFVLPVADSLAGIMRAVTEAALVHQSGGGTGFSFGSVRPSGAPIAGGGRATGPVPFIRIFDTATDVVQAGGLGRGANMAILPVTHPDVLAFVYAKNDLHSLTRFNVSVGISDAFMRAVAAGEWISTEFAGRPWTAPVSDPVTGADYVLLRGRSGEPVLPGEPAAADADRGGATAVPPPRPGMVYAPDLWRRLVASAHRSGEPGVVFLDTVNAANRLMASMGPLSSCNPCGEQFLHAYNACNLASIDASRFHHPVDRFDRARLARIVRLGVRFLDDAVEVGAWPLPAIEETVRRTRPVGLGMMGFADLCLKLGIRYGSAPSVRLMEELLSFVRREAWQESLRLGKEKGAFPEASANEDAYADLLFGELGLPADGPPAPRNYQVTMAEPAATVAMVAETSSGIEPNFAWAWSRNDAVGARTYVHPLAARALGVEVDFADPDSIARAADAVLERESSLPEHFVTALSIPSREHVDILAAAQRHVDNSVSKTCNGDRDDSLRSVDELFQRAWSLGCKAVSYYRDGSREDQTLAMLSRPEAATGTDDAASCDCG